MKTQVTETSLEAYRTLPLHNRMTTASRIMRAVETGCITRRQIEARTGIPINAVCGRVNELIAAGRLDRGPEVKDEVTGRTVETLRIV